MSTPEDRHSERNCTIQDATAETTPLLPTASDSRYSVFTKNQKRCIILAAALASAFSPLSANIYYPALNSIAKDLHVSPSQINLTITTYMVYQYINLLDEVNADSIDANQLCQGIAPTFTGSLADQAGRRPAYICCFVVYIAGNIALALQHWFPALLALRAVQSCGSSGTVALASAVAADIITSAERGAYMGFASLGNILAPSLGPIAGGLLSQYFGWQVIFWFLAAAAVLFFVPFLLFFPETCRAIVEDGSIKPTGWNRSLSSWFKERSSERSRTAEPCAVPRKELDIPNPLSSLKLLLQRPVGLILMVNGLVFGSYYAVTAGIPVQFEALYGLDDLKIGLCFIPAGMGSLLTATVNGILVDWNYRRALVRTGQQVHINYKHNILSFPIERARLQVGIPMTILGAVFIAGYGILMSLESPLWVALLMIFLICFCITAAYNVMNVLIVDIYYTTPATAMAANNLVRCLLGAGAAAAVNPTIERLGPQRTYCVVSGILIAVSPLLVLVYLRGWKWRQMQAGVLV